MPPAPLPFESDIHELEVALERMEASVPSGEAPGEQIKSIRRTLLEMKKERYSNLSPWQTVLVSRHPQRPQTVEYLQMIFTDYVELHGDRAFGDDRAIRCGFARLGDSKVMLIGHQKGHNHHERTECYYGCAHPEGYRKALSKMRLAAKFN